jgi:hypothetical protein
MNTLEAACWETVLVADRLERETNAARLARDAAPADLALRAVFDAAEERSTNAARAAHAAKLECRAAMAAGEKQ